MTRWVSWREWAGILATCTMSGTALGTVFYWIRMPSLPAAYLLFVLAGAFIVALVFASVASLLGAIVLILVARYVPQAASRIRLAVAGAACGAVTGAVHPFVLMVALLRALSGDSPAASIVPLAALVAASGAVAGALLVPRYVPAVRARA